MSIPHLIKEPFFKNHEKMETIFKLVFLTSCDKIMKRKVKRSGPLFITALKINSSEYLTKVQNKER